MINVINPGCMSAASSTLFMFRHIITNQVVLSRKQALTDQCLFFLGKHNKPSLRKDLWKPLLILTDLKDLHLSSVIINSFNTYPRMFMPTETKRICSKSTFDRLMSNQVEHKVKALCRILMDLELNNNFKSQLLILWESFHFKDLVYNNNNEEKLDWPTIVKHDKLILEFGRKIKNERFDLQHIYEKRFKLKIEECAKIAYEKETQLKLSVIKENKI